MASFRHPATRPGRRPGQRAKLLAIWLVIIGAAAGFTAVAIHAAWQPPDPFARCQRGGPVSASTVVIVDTTDPLTDIQRRRVRATVEAERDRLPRGGKLTVLGIAAEAPGEPREIVSACNPGSVDEANPLFETASRTEKRWTETFGGPIDAAIQAAADQPPSPASPIIATAAAALTRPDFDARVARRRMVIVSDLLEHDAGVYSQLTGGDFWAAYQRSALPGRVRLDLRGVAVAIDYLARPAYAAVQGERHRDFWRRLFGEAGASEVNFVGLLAPTMASPESGGGAQWAERSVKRARARRGSRRRRAA